jgi:hypothetical protein
MSKQRSVLKKIAGTVVDFDYSKEGSTLEIDGKYVASCWRPFTEKNRKESVALLTLIRNLFDEMILQQEELPLHEIDKEWLSKLE